MAQDYSGQLDKPNKAITAPKLSLHNLECWQINLHRCKAASYNMCEVTKNVRSGLVLVQEPWTYAPKIRSKLRGWYLFQGIDQIKFRENLPNSQKFRGPTQSGRSQGSQR